MNWLLLDSKLCIILFIVGDSVCLSLRYETEAGFLVIVLVGKLLKAKGSGDIISLEVKALFCSCSVVSVIFLILLGKSYPFSFALLTQVSNFFSMFMFSSKFIFCRHQ